MGREGKGRKGRGRQGRGRGGEGTGRELTPIFYCTPSSSFLEICLPANKQTKQINAHENITCLAAEK